MRQNPSAKKFLLKNIVSITSGRSMEEIAKNTKSVWRSKGKSKSTLDRLMSQYPEVQLATLVDAPPEGEKTGFMRLSSTDIAYLPSW